MTALPSTSPTERHLTGTITLTFNFHLTDPLDVAPLDAITKRIHAGLTHYSDGREAVAIEAASDLLAPIVEAAAHGAAQATFYATHGNATSTTTSPTGRQITTVHATTAHNAATQGRRPAAFVYHAEENLQVTLRLAPTPDI